MTARNVPNGVEVDYRRIAQLVTSNAPPAPPELASLGAAAAPASALAQSLAEAMGCATPQEGTEV